MCSEYAPEKKTSGPTSLLPSLFVHICKSVVSLLLFVVVSWLSILWVVQSCRKFARKVPGRDRRFLVLHIAYSAPSPVFNLSRAVCTVQPLCLFESQYCTKHLQMF
jgi:hypothetical protein